MSPSTLRLALAAGAATLAFAGTASADDQVVNATTDVGNDPVSYSISVLDASGATVSTLACDWVGAPGDDDHACLAWAGDLGPTIDAIQAAGGVSSVTHVLAPAHQVDATTRISPRADGTWLIRTTGVNEDGPLHNGRVCDRGGRQCVSWDADGEAQAAKHIKRAAHKLQLKKKHQLKQKR
ncbi:MAG TPA: hypothetical protein VFG42_21340 [Baekduia sp.]|uniref:hypothetical protein n=1 Tax=Baekduia sp. TaxID=2600305 RepID=UPI002D7791C8|nr:hypothetical protein [Baekduia sp.]HET6509356.1 hypothetical protein [Baekduia sp.]